MINLGEPVVHKIAERELFWSIQSNKIDDELRKL